jgi:signal transduction histidine kinase
VATPLRLLLVEDSADDAEILLLELRRAGYDPASERVQTAAALSAALARGEWDLVISDHGLPGFSAPEALTLLQESGLDVPFIIVSGAIGEETAVQAMRAGARDYIMKDNLARLGPAIVRELREAEARRERRRLEEQFRQAQRMEAIGRLAGGVAHDFNNLLTVIRSRTEFLRSGLPAADPGRREADMVLEAATRAATLTRQLLVFSRGQVLQPAVLDLNTVVRDLESMLRRMVGERIALRAVLAPALGAVKADQAQVEQVIMNLVVNARDAMPEGGRLTIETANIDLDEAYCRSRVDSRPGPHVMLAVSDTGVGMDAETQAHLFEPFFTTKEPDRGTGLGLAVVYGAVKQNGAFIEVFSKPGRGTSVEVFFPRATGAAPAGGGARGFEGPLQGSETVLLVEDQEPVRLVARDILQRHGYTVLEATHGGEALAILERRAEDIALVVTDIVMPHMGGPEMIRRMAARNPRMKVLYMSGYSDETLDYTGLGAAFVEKPFSPEIFARKVRELLDAPPPRGVR